MTAQVLPADAHNQTLVDHVHPVDWKNPTPKERYDMVVVGAGTAGLITAIGAAGMGKTVALVERHLMGGDCLNFGCVPSKALIRCARAAADVRDAAAYGVHVPEGGTIDFGKVMERMRRLRAGIAAHDGAQRFTDLGADVFLGDAAFTGSDALAIGQTTLHFKRACIATGARAAVPPIDGLSDINYLTNETVFSLTELPKRLAVVGAGPIGCELAQSFARFGSEVFLVESSHGILPREDPEAAEIVKQALVKDGVNLLCCGRALRFAQQENGIRLNVDTHDAQYDQAVDAVIVAVGRTPNTDGLGLDRAGVRFDKDGVQVDDGLRTTNPRIFAAGDICSKYKFTHAADAMARIVLRNALLGWIPGRAKASKLVMPWATYTEPEIAHVGAYPNELKDKGITFKTVQIDMGSIDRAILEGSTDGLLKVHVRPNGKILGATLVGEHAGDMISELTTAMTHGIKLQKIAKVIHPYPTQAEIIKRAGDQYFKTWLLGLKDKILFWK